MDPQLHFLTLSTPSLHAARRFYTDALGWTPLLDVEGEIVFYQVAPGTVLGFFDSEKFAADLGPTWPEAEVKGLTLAHNVASRDQVAEVVAAMERGGGTVLTAPREGTFGGVFHAHVQDPNGVIWEVAHNPGWSVAADGAVSFG
jgi:uncharacterized protein